MKVLFLDFDGVLNYRGWLINEADDLEDEYRKSDKKFTRENAHFLRDINPAAVQLLNDVMEANSDCSIVISSAWRVHHPLDELKSLLSHQGFLYSHKIIDKTSTGFDDNRGKQIRDWIITNLQKVDKIAIVDDYSSDMAPFFPFLTQTSGETGLLPEHVEDINKTFRMEYNLKEIVMNDRIDEQSI